MVRRTGENIKRVMNLYKVTFTIKPYPSVDYHMMVAAPNQDKANEIVSNIDIVDLDAIKAIERINEVYVQQQNE